ncbi:hypothetical protein C6400_15560 [Klebsiella michiganensis]|nr:hypothetical protein C6400_15560 [Klebsiella michiganensis]
MIFLMMVLSIIHIATEDIRRNLQITFNVVLPLYGSNSTHAIGAFRNIQWVIQFSHFAIIKLAQ